MPSSSFTIRAALLVGTTVLAGCMVGPDPTPPAMVLPDAWHADLVDGLDGDAWSPHAWWRTFEDPLLDELIASAERNNLDLRIAASRIRESRAAFGVAAADLYPQFSLDADSYFRDGQPSNVQSVDTDEEYYTGSLDLGWEIDLWGRVRRSMQSAEYTVLASIEDLRDALVSIRAEVARSYLEARSLQGQLAAILIEVETQRRTLELVEAQYRMGTTNELLVAQAQAQLADALAMAPPHEEEIANAVNRISVLLGTSPGPLRDRMRETFDPERPVPMPSERIAVGIPADTIRRRPDVRAAERSLMSAAAEVGVAEAALYPTLRINGTGGFSSTRFREWLDVNNLGGLLEIEVTWPFFTAGRLRSVVKARTEIAQQALLEYERTVLEAISEVENAIVAYAATVDERDRLRRAVESYREAERLAVARYEAGRDDLQTLLTIERLAIESVQNLAQAEGQVASNVVGLYKALGGAWEIREEPTRSLADAPDSEEERG